MSERRMAVLVKTVSVFGDELAFQFVTVRKTNVATIVLTVQGGTHAEMDPEPIQHQYAFEGVRLSTEGVVA
jgi:hypothetical protein